MPGRIVFGSGNGQLHDPRTCYPAGLSGRIVFFQQVQAAVNAGDKTKLASMVSYPMRTTLNGKRVQIRTRHQFLQMYPQLFNRRSGLCHQERKGLRRVGQLPGLHGW